MCIDTFLVLPSTDLTYIQIHIYTYGYRVCTDIHVRRILFFALLTNSSPFLPHCPCASFNQKWGRVYV